MVESTDEAVLPVDLKPVSDFLTGRAGAPVWPARTSDERAALGAIVATFGGRIAYTTGASARVSVTDAAEEVVSYGHGCNRLARLYAHLTRRRHRSAGSRAAIWDGGRPSVIVTMTSLLDDDILHQACDGGPVGSVTGLICLPEDERLAHRQVLTRAAAAALCGPLADRELLFFPRGDFGEVVQGQRRIIGARVGRETVLRTLAGRAGVLAISAHSDGIDLDLGPELMLCPFVGEDGAAVAAHATRPPRCRMTGCCHRLDRPLSAALNTPRLVSADAIAARILALYVCQGLLHSDGVVHPAWGIMPRILANPAIGAVVTSWSFILASPIGVGTLTALAGSGLPLGRALAEYNRSKAAIDLGHTLCLLGDPCVRLPGCEPGQPSADAVQNATAPSPPSRKAAKRRLRRGEHSFLRACLPPHLADLPDEQAQRVRKVLGALAVYEDAAWRGLPVDDGENGYAGALRAAFIDYVVGGGAQTLGLAESVAFARSISGYRRPERCFCCGRHLRSTLVTLRIPDCEPRRMDICPRCGITSDAPPRLRVKIRVRAGLIEISGPTPADGWAAGLYVKAWHPADSFGFRWPPAQSGVPRREQRIGGDLPCGQLRLYFYLMVGQSLTIASCPWRRELGEPTSSMV